MGNLALFATHRTPAWGGVFEVGAVVVDEDGMVLGGFESLINPGAYAWCNPEGRAALARGGVEEAWIRQAPAAWQVGASLRSWLVQHQVTVVSAWSTIFGLDELGMGCLLAPVIPPLRMGPSLQHLIQEGFRHRLAAEKIRGVLDLPSALAWLEISDEGLGVTAQDDANRCLKIWRHLTGTSTQQRRARMKNLMFLTPVEAPLGLVHPATLTRAQVAP